MAPTPLATADNLFDFFREQVDAANDATGKPVSEEGGFYLAQLLTERGTLPAANRPHTLAELRMKAQWADRPQAIKAWRELGDEALYTVGFFRGSIEHRNLDVSYFREMGAGAYDRLARILGGFGGPAPGGPRGMDDIFAELAGCFAACGEILREVREQVRAQSDDTSDAAVLALYEEWRTTGSRHAAARLRALGVIPMGGAGEDPAC